MRPLADTTGDAAHPTARPLAAATTTILAAALLWLAAPAPARAASLVYLDPNYNVWITSPDGARKKQVTTDGTPDFRYKAPTADDSGAIVSYGHPEKFWARIMNQDGANVRGPWLLPAPLCSISPFASEISADGKLIAVSWIDAGTSLTSCLQPGQLTTSLIFGDAVTLNVHNGAAALPSFDDKLSPRWIYRPSQRLGAIDQDSIYVQDFETSNGQMASWIGVPTATADLDSFDVSRVADRVLVETSGDGFPTGGEQRDLELLSFTGAPPNAAVTHMCFVDALVAPSTRTAEPRWSPDGTMISWSGPAGVYVSPAPVPGANDQCTLQPTLIAAGGFYAAWTPADVTVPPAPPPPPPAPPSTPSGPATTPPPAATPQSISAAKVGGASSAAGIALALTIANPGRIRVKVERLPAAGQKGKPKLVGTLSFAGKAGLNRLKIKRVAGRRLKRGRYRLTIIVPGAKPRVLIVTLRR